MTGLFSPGNNGSIVLHQVMIDNQFLHSGVSGEHAVQEHMQVMRQELFGEPAIKSLLQCPCSIGQNSGSIAYQRLSVTVTKRQPDLPAVFPELPVQL